MSDPTAVSITVAAGATAGVLTALSLEPGPLFWGLVGASLGMTAAAPATRRRAVVVFVCVVLASSVLGSLLARHMFDGAQLARNACSCVMALFFHPISNAAVAQIPDLLRRLGRRIGPDGSNP